MLKRHKIDISKLGDQSFLEGKMDRSLSKMESNPDMNLVILVGRTKNLLLRSILEKSSLAEIHKYAQLRSKFSLIELKRNTQDVSFTFKGQSYHLNKYLKQKGNTHHDAFQLLNLGLIFNDLEMMNNVLALELNEAESPYAISRFHFLRAFLNEDMDVAWDEFSKLMEYTKNGTTIYHSLAGDKIINSPEVARRFKIMNTPIIQLFKLAYEQDEINFNLELEKYSMEKRVLIGRLKKLHESEHWVDLNALAVCAFAKKKGLNITFISEYIPLWMIEE